MMNRFWQFNIGHALTILALAVSGVAIYVAHERERAVFQVTLEAHTVLLAQQAEKISDLDRKGSSVTLAQMQADHAALVALASRVEAQAITIGKVEVMANDISWIKAELERRRSEESRK